MYFKTINEKLGFHQIDRFFQYCILIVNLSASESLLFCSLVFMSPEPCVSFFYTYSIPQNLFSIAFHFTCPDCSSAWRPFCDRLQLHVSSRCTRPRCIKDKFIGYSHSQKVQALSSGSISSLNFSTSLEDGNHFYFLLIFGFVKCWKFCEYI